MAKRTSESNHSAAKAIISGCVEPADLYVLLGDDSCLSGRMIKLISRQFIKPEDEEFNFDIIDCQNNPPAAAITNALCELPVMCEKRLLVLLSAQALSSSACKAIAASLQNHLPYHTNIVILVSNTKKKDSLAGMAVNSPAFASIVYDCALLESERESWIAHSLQQFGLNAAPTLIRQISERTGSDTQFLQTQLEKLKQYLGERQEVTSADIKTVIRKSIEIKSWELTEAIRSKNMQQAWRLAQDMLASDTANRTVDFSRGTSGKNDNAPVSVRALGLLSYINTYLRSLAQLQHLSAQHGRDISAIAQQTGKKDYQVRKSLEELQTWTSQSLHTAFTALCLSDYHIKKGRDPLLAIQLLLTRLCLRKK
ncbi:MAG: DNA polymerase III subunit delta [bacterium]|nr:DNA polymerase III subunit delta [bacterium]